MSLKKHEATLRKAALAYPEVTEDFPWGHRTLKVKKKAFVFMVLDDAGLSFTVKLPSSSESALTLPFCEPTGYGLGKSGWVSAQFKKANQVPVDLLIEWMDESYRAVAPKRVAALLDENTPAKARRSKAPRSTKRRPA